MMEEKIIEIADALGVEVSELWGWLKSGGVQALQSAKVSQYGVIVGLAALVVAAMAVLLAINLKAELDAQREYDNDGSRKMSNYASFTEHKQALSHERFLYATALIVSASVLVILLPKLVAWIVSPEGMVLQMIAG